MSNVYSEEEVSLVGMLNEKDLDGHDDMEVDVRERIVHDALGLAPMFGPLMTDLENKGKVDKVMRSV